MYFTIIQQMKKGLVQLEAWIDKATAHAQAKGYDANVLVGMRLAPDQFALGRQIMIACDTAKLAVARLTGVAAPRHEDTETTLPELVTRIRSVVAWLGEIGPEAFAGAAERIVSQPRWEGRVMTGADYFVEHAVPNFYFHLTTAYAILRHAGIDLGKRDYLGQLSLRQPG